ncbi:hypothetical protein Hanom_Chr05g00446541 [Helianthus anomalus]
MLLLNPLMWSKSLSLKAFRTQAGSRKRGAHPLTQLLIGPVEKKMHLKQKGTLAQLRKATLEKWGKAYYLPLL